MTRKPPSRKYLTRKADEAFAYRIRSIGRCQLSSWFPKINCNGALQCCHIISRRYKAVRWIEDNAVAGCAAHHLYGTHHPIEWENAAVAAGVDYETLRWRAINEPPERPEDVLERMNAA